MTIEQAAGMEMIISMIQMDMDILMEKNIKSGLQYIFLTMMEIKSPIGLKQIYWKPIHILTIVT